MCIHFMNVLVVVNMAGYFTSQGVFRGYLVDATVYKYCNIPASPADFLILAYSGFHAGGDTLVSARCGQMPNIQRRELNWCKRLFVACLDGKIVFYYDA